MANENQKRWNDKHEHEHHDSSPSDFLRHVFSEHASDLQPGRALDIATGKGRNAIFLAARGFSVEAIDISEVALGEARNLSTEKGLDIKFKQADLETFELPHDVYDLVLNFNFLQRSLIPKIRLVARKRLKYRDDEWRLSKAGATSL